MSETTVVAASRYWGCPVKLTVDDEYIAVSVSFDDFLVALKQEIGSVTWVWKDSTFQAKVDAAAAKVMEKFKAEAAMVAHHVPHEG